MSEQLWLAYDEMGRGFEQHAENGPYNAHYDRPAVLDALGPVAGSRVLDAACGPGFYAAELIRRGAQVSAFDASETMAALAKARTAGAATVGVAMLGEPLPYPDGDFDAVICALAIHYASDRAAVFAEFYRVLRPGGIAVISTQHPTADWLRKGGSYFDVVLETDTWRLACGDQQVSFWREPLTDLCAAATGSGFLIERLIEPPPAESMRELYPKDYKYLRANPGFLILRLVKR